MWQSIFIKLFLWFLCSSLLFVSHSNHIEESVSTATFSAGICDNEIYTEKAIIKPFATSGAKYLWDDYIYVSVLEMNSNEVLSIYIQPVNENAVALGPPVEWCSPCEKMIPLYKTAYHEIHLKIINNTESASASIFGYWYGTYYCCHG